MANLLGFCLGLVARLWAATWRVRLVLGSGVELEGPAPLVFAFWHGQQLGLLAARSRPVATLVSWSKDGELQAGAMAALGIQVARGSSSRAGATGLRALLRRLRAGADGAFAADGPRGPLGRAKPGAALAAKRAGACLIPLASAAAQKLVLRRAWDHFEIPLPFTSVVIVAGSPVDAPRALREPALLERAIDACRQRAEAESERSAW